MTVAELLATDAPRVTIPEPADFTPEVLRPLIADDWAYLLSCVDGEVRVWRDRSWQPQPPGTVLVSDRSQTPARLWHIPPGVT